MGLLAAFLALVKNPDIVTNVTNLVVLAIGGVQVKGVLVLEGLRGQQELAGAADLRRLIVVDVQPVLVPQIYQVVADLLSVVLVHLLALLLQVENLVLEAAEQSLLGQTVH